MFLSIRRMQSADKSSVYGVFVLVSMSVYFVDLAIYDREIPGKKVGHMKSPASHTKWRKPSRGLENLIRLKETARTSPVQPQKKSLFDQREY